jgi:hypothetical protein
MMVFTEALTEIANVCPQGIVTMAEVLTLRITWRMTYRWSSFSNDEFTALGTISVMCLIVVPIVVGIFLEVS